MKIRLLLPLLLILLLAACQETDVATPTAVADLPTSAPTSTVEPTAVPPTSTPIPTATPDPFVQGTNGYPWWNDTVFYEIFVRSFYDSDGDGIGDLNGVIEKLDYLNDGDPNTSSDLGITGIWLMPIMVSPSYHGYDVVDYFQIDPDYGTNEDFLRLMDEAHARGIHVIVDFVMNHTSTQHPWFIESKDPNSDLRDWYVWSDENPGYLGPWGQGVWHNDPSGYYYGVFWSGMPDLNYANPAVTEAMFERIQFWLEEMHVDGFRLDAIKHMIEDGRIQENSFSTHEWLEQFYTFYKEINPNAFTVGEAWTGTQQVLDYTGDEVDVAFQFDLALDILNSTDTGITSVYVKTQELVYEAFPANQYATFITNHDQNRVMSQLDGDEAKARLAASLLLTGTGVPFIYYGEEIGMMGVKPDEDIRLPLQWASNGPKVGFTTGTPWRPAAADFPVRSIERQDDDPDSLLNHYRALIHLRNEHAALRVGDWTLLEANSNRLYTFLRQTDNETILVVINFNRNPVLAEDYGIELPDALTGAVTAVSLYGLAPTNNPTGGSYVPFTEIPPQSTHIIQLVSEG
ncbi:MAG: alpha-glucosidase C-terminal domain-containing protein [Anaerolineales bacterium]|nr:alpha-glucosidase C-terminal domain-containing protein [Anaerolineales bacterium]